MCFQINCKSAQKAKCVKSRIMTEVIDYVLSIDKFEQQCVVLKVMLQSPHLKDHMKTIGIYQSLSNIGIFEHRCHKNIKKLYQHAGKCNDQQKFKDILKSAMVYTPEGFTYNSPRYPMKSTPVKKPSGIKSLCLFTDILDVKNKTAIIRVGYAK